MSAEIPKVKERPIQGHICLLVCSKSIRKVQRDSWSHHRKRQFRVVRDSLFCRKARRKGSLKLTAIKQTNYMLVLLANCLFLFQNLLLLFLNPNYGVVCVIISICNLLGNLLDHSWSIS